MRRFRALAVLSLLSGFIALGASVGHATPLNILSKNFSVFGGMYTYIPGDGPSDSKSGPNPVSINLESPGSLIGSADGSIGQAQGFLSTFAYLMGAAGGVGADATMDFRPTDRSILTLNVFGSSHGSGYSSIELLNLTDNVMLLSFIVSSDQRHVTDSFTFQLDPSKNYRLAVHSDTPPDQASARADYLVVPVPEPSGLWLIVGAAAILLRRNA